MPCEVYYSVARSARRKIEKKKTKKNDNNKKFARTVLYNIITISRAEYTSESRDGRLEPRPAIFRTTRRRRRRRYCISRVGRPASKMVILLLFAGNRYFIVGTTTTVLFSFFFSSHPPVPFRVYKREIRPGTRVTESRFEKREEGRKKKSPPVLRVKSRANRPRRRTFRPIS